MVDLEAPYYYIDKDFDMINKEGRTISPIFNRNTVEGITLEGY